MNPLVKALESAIEVIKNWHNRDEVWDIYYNHSPEMKSIREALSLYSQLKPKVICYCGSLRVALEAFKKAEYEAVIWGEIALLPCCMFVDIQREYGAESDYKQKADELHKRKIDICDEVFVLNVGGYIGESTRNEINYALKINKPIKYLEPLNQSENSQSKEGEGYPSAIVVWKDGTYKEIKKESSWEYENDANWLVTISQSKENEGKQAVWVKATIRKPEKGIYHVKVSNKLNTVVMFGVGLVTIGEFSVIRFLNGTTLQEENNGFEDGNIEWLDESTQSGERGEVEIRESHTGRMVKSMEAKTQDGWIDRIVEETGSNNVKNIFFNGKKWVVEYKSDLSSDEFEFFNELYTYLNI